MIKARPASTSALPLLNSSLRCCDNSNAKRRSVPVCAAFARRCWLSAVPMCFKLKSSSSYQANNSPLMHNADDSWDPVCHTSSLMHDQNVVRTWNAKAPKCIGCISSMHKVSNPTNVLRENSGQRCLAVLSAEGPEQKLKWVLGNVDVVHDDPVGTSDARFSRESELSGSGPLWTLVEPQTPKEAFVLVPRWNSDTPIASGARGFVATGVFLGPRQREHRQTSCFRHVPTRPTSATACETWVLMVCPCGKAKGVRKLGPVAAHPDHDSFEAEELACEVFVVVRAPPRAKRRGVSVGSAPQLSERSATPNTGRRTRASTSRDIRSDTLRAFGVLQLSAAAPSLSSRPRCQDTSQGASRLLRPITRPKAVLCKAVLSLQLRASCSSGPTFRRRPQLAPLCRNSELTPLSSARRSCARSTWSVWACRPTDHLEQPGTCTSMKPVFIDVLSPSTLSKCSLSPPPVREGFTANEVPRATIRARGLCSDVTFEFLLYGQVEKLLAALFRRHLGITGALFRVRVPSRAVLWDLIPVIPLFTRQQSPLPVMRARHVSKNEHDRSRGAKSSRYVSTKL